MSLKIRARLERLEQVSRTRDASVLEQIVSTALQALSNEDLAILHDISIRGGRCEDCTPEQRAVVRRYGSEWGAAASKVLGRGLDDLDVKARIAEMERIEACSSLPAPPATVDDATGIQVSPPSHPGNDWFALR
jgi:hypothetical protein